MATIDQIAGRCAYTAAALATLGADPAWDERLTTYLRADALQQAHSSFGPLARANEEHNLECIKMEADYGLRWKSHPAANGTARSAAAAQAAEAEWTEQYCEPYWQAARDLAMAPAPTLAAALFKVRLIEWDELDNDGPMPRDCFVIVAEDMARLAGGQV